MRPLLTLISILLVLSGAAKNSDTDSTDEKMPRRHWNSHIRYCNKRTVDRDSLEIIDHRMYRKGKVIPFTGYIRQPDAVEYYRFGRRTKRISYYDPAFNRPKSVSRFKPLRNNGKTVNIAFDIYGRKTSRNIRRNGRATKIVTWNWEDLRRTVKWNEGSVMY